MIKLIAQNEVSQMMCSIGSCDASGDATLFGDIPPYPEDTIDIEDQDDEAVIDHIFAAVSSGQLDLEDLPFKDDKQASFAFHEAEGRIGYPTFASIFAN